MVRYLFFLVALLPFIGGCCACRKGSPVIGNLEKTNWILVELMEQPVKTEISVNFDPSSKTLGGSCECNRIYAGYHLFARETGNIEFLQPGHSGEGCPENPEITSLSGLLPSVTTAKIDGGHLLLMDSVQNIVAIFRQPYTTE